MENLTLEYVYNNIKPHQKRVEDLTKRNLKHFKVLGYAGNRQWFCHCECGNIFLARTDRIKSGFSKHCGCLKSEYAKQNDTPSMVKRFKEMHGDKYDYSKFEYEGADVPSTIICPIHGEFEQRPNVHLRPAGCSKCGHVEKSKKRTKSTEQFVEDAIKVHGDKYSYDNSVYTNVKDKITITCPVHGDFEQTASDHLSGYGCQGCQKDLARVSQDDFIKRVVEIHMDTYDFSEAVYTRSDEKVKVICKEHGEFYTTPNSLYGGHGCPNCGNYSFKTNKPAIFYIVRWYGYGEEYIKLGITGNFSKRLAEQDRVSKLDHEVLYCFPFSTGQQAADLESEAKQLLNCGVCSKELLPDGYSETINVSDLPKLLELISSHVNK